MRLADYSLKVAIMGNAFIGGEKLVYEEHRLLTVLLYVLFYMSTQLPPRARSYRRWETNLRSYLQQFC